MLMSTKWFAFCFFCFLFRHHARFLLFWLVLYLSRLLLFGLACVCVCRWAISAGLTSIYWWDWESGGSIKEKYEADSRFPVYPCVLYTDFDLFQFNGFEIMINSLEIVSKFYIPLQTLTPKNKQNRNKILYAAKRNSSINQASIKQMSRSRFPIKREGSPWPTGRAHRYPCCNMLAIKVKSGIVC